MKTIYRTLAILAAALVIVGVLLVLSSTSLTTNSDSIPERSAIVQSQANGSAGSSSSGASGAAAPFDHDKASGPSLAGLVEVLKSLGIVAVIITIVSQGKRLLNRKRPPERLAQRQTRPRTPAPSL